jgi:hypothetical protein
MKSKKSPARRIRKSAPARGRAAEKTARAVILDFIKGRIELYFAKEGGGIVVRKDRTAYTLVMDDSSIPVARLVRASKTGGFDVSCWSRSRNRWERLGEWGASFPTLDEALDFITDDPLECFWL